jgi:hypothetical protein
MALNFSLLPCIFNHFYILCGNQVTYLFTLFQEVIPLSDACNGDIFFELRNVSEFALKAGVPLMLGHSIPSVTRRRSSVWLLICSGMQPVGRRTRARCISCPFDRSADYRACSTNCVEHWLAIRTMSMERVA